MNTNAIYPPEKEPQNKRKFWLNKVLSLLLLSILLVIPSLLIMQLTTERQKRKNEAYENISGMWGKPQTISGFYLRIPHKDQDIYIYPDSLDVQTELVPEIRKRGIYKVPVYKNNIKMHSKFFLKSNSQQWSKLNGADLSRAKLVLQLFDLSKGLDNDMSFKVNGQALEGEPVINDGSLDDEYYEDLSESNGRTTYNKKYDHLEVHFPFRKEQLLKGLDVNSDFTLNGTEYFKIIPTAIHNNFSIAGKWADPSAIGNRLPSEPLKVNNGKFNTTWNFINRSISEVTETAFYKLKEEAVGVSLLITVDNYTKVERSLKYALMIIVLCFAAMFMLEVFNKKELHIIHYALTGMSLIVFYILLLSISEYLGFNMAYLIAATATILLLVWFVGGILRSRKLGMYLGGILGLMYSYNFVLLNAKEYALLMGSIGLFAVMFIIMYFTRKMNFDN